MSAASLLCAAIALSRSAFTSAWNQFRFGDPLDFGYNWIETVPQLPVRVFLLSDLPRGLLILLLSPGKSILLWAPVICLSHHPFLRESTPDESRCARLPRPWD